MVLADSISHRKNIWQLSGMGEQMGVHMRIQYETGEIKYGTFPGVKAAINFAKRVHAIGYEIRDENGKELRHGTFNSSDSSST
jgi:hypothetical protein